MWKQLWRKWTIDRPAALGDWLWEILVVQLAACLDRLTLRRIIALIPVGILVLAYAHSIPIPPELMLVGDLLAYIDIVAVILLLGMISRASAILFVTRQAAERAIRLVGAVLTPLHRLDLRHRREGGAKTRKTRFSQAKTSDDEPAAIGGFAWA